MMEHVQTRSGRSKAPEQSVTSSVKMTRRPKRVRRSCSVLLRVRECGGDQGKAALENVSAIS